MTLGTMVLELLQNFGPGRTPGISSFVVSSVGARSGFVMAILAYTVLGDQNTARSLRNAGGCVAVLPQPAFFYGYATFIF